MVFVTRGAVSKWVDRRHLAAMLKERLDCALG